MTAKGTFISRDESNTENTTMEHLNNNLYRINSQLFRIPRYISLDEIVVYK